MPDSNPTTPQKNDVSLASASPAAPAAPTPASAPQPPASDALLPAAHPAPGAAPSPFAASLARLPVKLIAFALIRHFGIFAAGAVIGHIPLLAPFASQILALIKVAIASVLG